MNWLDEFINQYEKLTFVKEIIEQGRIVFAETRFIKVMW